MRSSSSNRSRIAAASALLVPSAAGSITVAIVPIIIGLIAFVLAIPAFVLVALGAATGTVLGFGVTLAIAIVWLIAVSCWTSAMTAVFQLSLYRFATQAPLPQEFAAINLNEAFGPEGATRRFGF